MDEGKMIEIIQDKIDYLQGRIDKEPAPNHFARAELAATKQLLNRYNVLKRVCGPIWPWAPGAITGSAIDLMTKRLSNGTR